MNLYELTGDYCRLQEALVNGEELDEQLTLIEDELENKADAYAKIMRNNVAMIDGIKAEKDRLSKRQKQLESANEWLKTTLYSVMKETGKTKFKTDLFSFAIQKNGGKAPIVVDVETKFLPDNLVKIEEKPDLEALRKYIEETGDCTFAHIGEVGESLRIK